MHLAIQFFMKNILKLIRPHQYIKNLFIFLPLFFAGKMIDGALFLKTCIAFVAFSAAASTIYIFNDFVDVNDDRRHPQKKFRPLALGAISKKNTAFLIIILFISSLSLMLLLSLHATTILSIYILLNIAYTFYLKHIALIDVTIIAIGFVLRLFVGASVTNISLSMWIVLMTFLLALFLALAKRRDDIQIFLNTGKKMRKVVDGYNLKLIDGAMIIMASVVIVTYILYTTSMDVMQRLQNEYIYITTLFVILGIMRYLQITLVNNDSGSPTKIALKDTFMKAIILAWVLSFAWILYL